MTDLITRLQRLSGDNPVAFVKLTADDWPDIAELIADAERHRWLRDASGCSIEMPMGRGYLSSFCGNDLSEAIDNARKKETP